MAAGQEKPAGVNRRTLSPLRAATSGERGMRTVRLTYGGHGENRATIIMIMSPILFVQRPTCDAASPTACNKQELK
jgi:hypothetical protein